MTGEVILWLVIFVVLVVVEFASLQLISVWFAAGALVSLIVAACGAPFSIQILVFAAVSTLLLACTRKIVKKFLWKGHVETNAELDVGKTARVIEAIDNLKSTGRVSLNGIDWTARSSDGTNIDEGESVTVDKIDGAKLFVTLQK